MVDFIMVIYRFDKKKDMKCNTHPGRSLSCYTPGGMSYRYLFLCALYAHTPQHATMIVMIVP